MEQHPYQAPPPPPPPPAPPQAPPAPPPVWQGPPEASSAGQKLKKLLGPLGVVGVLIVKFFAKLKFIILPALKFFPVILKTGGTMILSIGAYFLLWGLWFAVGFVLLIFVHETGHLVAAKRLGLKVGAPVFIPFLGAYIALKEAPKNAWVEAQVGIGGPILGTLGAGICELIYLATGKPIFQGLAYAGFFVNLFNLAPLTPLDGGRIVTALSPKLWIVGLAIMVLLMAMQPNFLLVLILILALPRLLTLFRAKSEAEKRYFEVTPRQRVTMAVMYFGLIALLVLGMHITHVPPDAL
jgi:Zn-dependent protease